MHSTFNKFKPGHLLIPAFVLSVIWAPVNAQEKNSGDRYINAYKKYVTATCPIKKDRMRHFVYFAKDSELIKKHPFLSHSMFRGAEVQFFE